MMDESETPPHGGKAGVLDALEGLRDAELREVVKRGQAILAARDQERRREAVREIERLAKEHGIAVSIGGPPRKRGRPRKASTPTPA